MYMYAYHIIQKICDIISYTYTYIYYIHTYGYEKQTLLTLISYLFLSHVPYVTKGPSSKIFVKKLERRGLNDMVREIFFL